MSRARFSYRKLKQDHHDIDNHQLSESIVEVALEAARGVMRARAWSRLRRVPVRRRFRVRGIGTRMRKYLKSRKLRLVKKVKGSWEKVVMRVKEGQTHFGDLFAGNYLLLQVNPTPLKGVGGGGLGFAGDFENPMYYMPRISS